VRWQKGCPQKRTWRYRGATLLCQPYFKSITFQNFQQSIIIVHCNF
jgi:hypothetical protein